ncbi:MAG: YybH family protein [Desulfomonilaceae bacterium]
MKLMRFAVALLLIAFVSVSAWAAEPTQIEKEVKDWLNVYAKAYEKKDINALMSMIAAEAVFIDSSPQGRYIGADPIKKAYQAEFTQMQSVVMEPTWLTASTKGDLAWFAAELTAKVDLGKEKFVVPGRWTGVLEKREGKWVIILSHFSYTAMDEKEEK